MVSASLSMEMGKLHDLLHCLMLDSSAEVGKRLRVQHELRPWGK
jgi:hypothetical protein